MKFRSRIAAIAAGTACVAALVPLTAAPAGAVSEPEVVATGLDNPYKMSFGPDGSLYVAESGVGATEAGAPCQEFPEGGDLCLGLTGAVTRVTLGDLEQHRVAEGLPSLAPSDSAGGGATGPVDVAVDEEGNLYVVVGQGGPPSGRDALGADGAMLGTVVRVTPEGEASVFADLAAFEEELNPDADQPDAEAPDTNPFAIEVNPDGGFWAVDAGGNDVLSIDAEGTISLEAVLAWDETEAPPFIGAPPGTMIPFQPVPTSITHGPAGLIVTELTGFPFPVGEADIFEMEAVGETNELTSIASGFSAVVDAAQGPDGSIYVLEFAAEGLLAAESGGGVPTSRLTQLRPDGTRKILLQEELLLSNGVTVGPDGMVYVSNGSQLAGDGSVIRVHPGEARDPAAAAACDPDDVPGAGFTDVGANVHREAIECLAWWDVINGTSPTTFSPQARIRRDQAASIMARLLEAAGVTLPTSPPDAFDDDDGNVHEEAINALADLGVMLGRTATSFAPGADITRGQLASILVRAYEETDGDLDNDEIPGAPNAFDDDAGSVHEQAINYAADRGWVNGTGERTFSPNGNATRAQLTSMVARMLSSLVEEGVAEVPAVG